jgi:hypothetical protein
MKKPLRIELPQVLRYVPFCQLGRDVTVLDADNRVYFGGVGVAFPVIEDGTILRQCPGEVILNFPEEVRAIDRRGLGVELKWAPDLPPAPGI